MGNGDRFWRAQEKRDALRKADASGQIADSTVARTTKRRRMEVAQGWFGKGGLRVGRELRR